jgi:hypothetical protein
MRFKTLVKVIYMQRRFIIYVIICITATVMSYFYPLTHNRSFP